MYDRYLSETPHGNEYLPVDERETSVEMWTWRFVLTESHCEQDSSLEKPGYTFVGCFIFWKIWLCYADAGSCRVKWVLDVQVIETRAHSRFSHLRLNVKQDESKIEVLTSKLGKNRNKANFWGLWLITIRKIFNSFVIFFERKVVIFLDK